MLCDELGCRQFAVVVAAVVNGVVAEFVPDVVAFEVPDVVNGVHALVVEA